MSAAARRKGRTYQTAARQWWEARRFGVMEVGGAGMGSTDLVLLHAPLVSLEVKNHKAMELARWVDQAVAQAPHGAVAAVMHKRTGRGDVGESYVTLRAADFARLLEGPAA